MQVRPAKERDKNINRDPVINNIIKRLKDRLGERLIELWLYGSHARGDYSEDSDYDILVVTDGDIKQIKETVYEESYQILDSLNQLVGGLVYDKDSWSRIRNSPLGWNVRKEGIRLL
jgi:predicted nucleotidyltransferase